MSAERTPVQERGAPRELRRLSERVDALSRERKQGWWCLVALAMLGGALAMVGGREYEIGQLQNEVAFSHVVNEGLQERQSNNYESMLQQWYERCHHNTGTGYEEAGMRSSIGEAERVGWVDATRGQRQPEQDHYGTGHETGDMDDSRRAAEPGSRPDATTEQHEPIPRWSDLHLRLMSFFKKDHVTWPTEG